MIALENVTKVFNKGEITETTLFDGFDLRIEEGDFVSVVGSNGSGKTSMLNIICGSIPIEKGKVIIGSEDMTSVPEYRRYAKIGRVYQDPAKGTFPNMTILENMSVADNKGKRFGLSGGINRKRTEYYREILASLGLGLENKLDSKVSSLSGGQRQAMALLMSTLTPIEYLILDEHTAALDPKTADTIMELTERIVREKKLTALMVTHNLRYAVEYGNRLIMMHSGGIVLDKSGDDKKTMQVGDVLGIFNEISIECGN